MQILTLVTNLLATLQEVDLRHPIAISFGAIGGALSRYYLTLWFAERLGTSFPYGTFTINLSGALLMGFFTTLGLERLPISLNLRLMLATGFLGAYTTFSTYALDTSVLLRTRSRRAALFYWIGSAGFGMLCLGLGGFLASRVP